ncbi:hypothetical protein H8356DRAFT_1077678 [Neocallimastix lanati (nom. inval.)]|nr:hypothetical protein H8356DRAFT_1077678 [Neocallimastix sp. JGI-2020a]
MYNLKSLKQSIVELGIKFENDNRVKKEVKMNIQKSFSKLRDDLNNREYELMEQVDKNFDLILSEDMIKESENLPNKIKTSFEKGKLIDNQCDQIKLNSFINDCLIIENNIKNENQISELIKKFGTIADKTIFHSEIDFDEKLVKSWFNNRMFYSELLFRKTRDDSTSKDFHDKCDNKGNTIVFIETTNGSKFGVYILCFNFYNNINIYYFKFLNFILC